MHSNDYPWSEGRCRLEDGKWWFINHRTGERTYIENRNMILDPDHLEFLVVKALRKSELVGMN